MKVAFALVVHRASVILQRALVAERRKTHLAVIHLSGVGGQDVACETSLARELALARTALIRLVRGVCLHVASQGFLVLKCDVTLCELK